MDNLLECWRRETQRYLWRMLIRDIQAMKKNQLRIP